jgi:hydrogenase/urease accessory protein HupE
MRRAAAVVLALLSTVAQAHPGHAVADLWHLLTEPDHLAMLLVPVAIAAGLWWRSRRRR